MTLYKRSVFIISFLVCCGVSTAQSIKERIALYHYKKMNYALAARHLEELLAKDTANVSLMKKAANCFRKMNDPIKEEYWYAKLVNQKEGGVEAKLYYAQALASNRKYKEAAEWYQKYTDEDLHKDSRGPKFVEAYKNLAQFFEDTARHKVKTVAFNTPMADFSPVYYKKGLVFCSNRGEQLFIKRTFNWNEQPFLNLWYVDTTSNSVRTFSKKLNTKLHEGPFTFMDTEKELLTTRNNYHNRKVKMHKKGFNNLQMYFYSQHDTIWGDPVPFIHNNEDWSSGQPYYSTKRKEIYFISDRPDHIGGTDIYMCKINSKGKWTYPENLGRTINTEGNEMFPFVDKDGNMYFASDGHPGLGGLDVFFAERSGDTLLSPVNLGSPINTNKDDFGYILDTSNTFGYMSSNRDGGVGDDDIYAFRKFPLPPVYFKASIKDSTTGLKLDSVIVTVLDSLKQKSDIYFTEKGNNFSFKINRKTGYTLTVTRRGYLSKTFVLQSNQFKKLKDTLYANYALVEEIRCLTVTGIVKDLNTGKTISGASVFIKRMDSNDISFQKTDATGTFTYCLEPGKDYLVKTIKPKYQSGCITIQIKEKKKGDYVVAKPLLMKPFKLNMVFKVDNLLYDVAKWDIRPEATIELDKVVTFLKENESIKIELGSHTDSRGSDAQNLALSVKRAKSAVDYIISKGIDAKRIVAKGYGETKPLNKCKNKVKCKETEYQVNRRTEIKVIGFVPVVEQSGDEYETQLFNEQKDKANCKQVDVVLKK